MSEIISTAKPDITIILNNSHNNDGTHNLAKTKKNNSGHDATACNAAYTQRARTFYTHSRKLNEYIGFM